jgi:hypothetical protein
MDNINVDEFVAEVEGDQPPITERIFPEYTSDQLKIKELTLYKDKLEASFNQQEEWIRSLQQERSNLRMENMLLLDANNRATEEKLKVWYLLYTALVISGVIIASLIVAIIN